MKYVSLTLACLGMSGAVVGSSPFATAVLDYSPGTGFTPGYIDPLSALGEPSRATPGMFGGPVDPFNPPYLPSQLVSIGAGGSLTLSLTQPILNATDNPYGLDFILFGNNGFTIVNGDFSGGGITDGSTFTFDPPGASRVWVSADNVIYYPLVAPPGFQAQIDGLFPTDGSGNFQVPVDPTLANADFDGLGLSGIRGLYGQSGGGTGFDLAWATTDQGDAIALAEARYVRLEVLSGKVELDALTIVPEPSSGLLLLAGGFTTAAWLFARRRCGGKEQRPRP